MRYLSKLNLMLAGKRPFMFRGLRFCEDENFRLVAMGAPVAAQTQAWQPALVLTCMEVYRPGGPQGVKVADGISNMYSCDVQ